MQTNPQINDRAKTRIRADCLSQTSPANARLARTCLDFGRCGIIYLQEKLRTHRYVRPMLISVSFHWSTGIHHNFRRLAAHDSPPGGCFTHSAQQLLAHERMIVRKPILAL
jgi:hypothetical protein